MTYDYECTKCKTTHEVNKSFTEAQKKEHCPKCKTEMVRLYGVMKIVTGDMRNG